MRHQTYIIGEVLSYDRLGIMYLNLSDFRSLVLYLIFASFLTNFFILFSLLWLLISYVVVFGFGLIQKPNHKIIIPLPPLSAVLGAILGLRHK